MFIKVAKRANHWVWTLNRPDRRNGLGTTIAEEMALNLDELEKNIEEAGGPVSLVINAEPTTSSMGKIWVAGGDLKELQELDTKAKGRAYAESWSKICQRLEALPLIVIALINGRAMGGGAELALACDLRLGTHDTVFDFKQIKVGLATGYGGTRRLVDLVGYGHAQNFLLMSREVTWQMALTQGLLSEVCETWKQLESRAEEICESLSKVGSTSLSMQKQMLQLARPEIQRSYKEELNIFEKLWLNPKHRDFLQSFNKAK